MLVGLLVTLAVWGGSPDPPFREDEIIFPLEHMHNHSSSIVETPCGDWLVCWFHGRGEKGDNTLVIQGARKSKAGRHGRRAHSGKSGTWSSPFIMVDNQDLPDQNPVLFIDPQRKLWLFWISSLDNTSATYMLKYVTSTNYEGDGPPKWDWQDVLIGHPQDLEPMALEAIAKLEAENAALIASDEDLRKDIDGIKAAASNKLNHRLGWMTRQQPIMLSKDRMMLGLYSDIFNCSLAAFTEDSGKTWAFGKPIVLSSPGGVQPAFVQKKSGDIVAFMRDNGPPPKQICRAVSSDGGISWTEQPMDIPNPGSSVACIALRSGKWLLVGNDTTGGPRGGRTQLAAFLSDDEGATWKWKRYLEMHGPETAAAYPFAIQAKDGSVLCTYTYTPEPDETIKLARFNEAWVMAGEE